jgi:hypothetical protein
VRYCVTFLRDCRRLTLWCIGNRRWLSYAEGPTDDRPIFQDARDSTNGSRQTSHLGSSNLLSVGRNVPGVDKKQRGGVGGGAGERLARQVHTVRRRRVDFASGGWATGSGSWRRPCGFPARLVLEGNPGRHWRRARQQHRQHQAGIESVFGGGETERSSTWMANINETVLYRIADLRSTSGSTIFPMTLIVFYEDETLVRS